MEIFMFSRSLELIGIVSFFSSLEWYRKLSEPGTFSISFLESDAGTLQTGMILYNTDEPEPGIITKLTRESNGKGSELVIAKGYTLSRWLNQRIVATRELLSGTPSSIMRTLVTNNAISPANNDRKIPNLYLGNDDSVVTDTMQYQTEYTNLAKALTDIADSYELGTAMTTFAGQNIGAGKMDRVLQGARQGTLTAMGVSAVITALILLFGRSLMAVFTETPELIDLSYRMMQILAAGYIAMEVTQCLSGIMRGAGDTVTPMWIAIINTVIVRVPLAYGLVALSKTPELPQGNCAMMYVSLLVTWIIGATITFVLYRTGKWKRKANIVGA